MEALAGAGAEKGDHRPPFTWRARPAADPKKRMAVVLCAMGVFFLGIGLLHNVLVGIVGVLAILGSTSEIWIGTRYMLDEEGAQSARGPSVTKILWKDVREFHATETGIHLLPVPEGSRLAPFRGVFLQFEGVGKAELAAKIGQFGGPDVSSVA